MLRVNEGNEICAPKGNQRAKKEGELIFQLKIFTRAALIFLETQFSLCDRLLLVLLQRKQVSGVCSPHPTKFTMSTVPLTVWKVRRGRFARLDPFLRPILDLRCSICSCCPSIMLLATLKSDPRRFIYYLPHLMRQ